MRYVGTTQVVDMSYGRLNDSRKFPVCLSVCLRLLPIPHSRCRYCFDRSCSDSFYLSAAYMILKMRPVFKPTVTRILPRSLPHTYCAAVQAIFRFGLTVDSPSTGAIRTTTVH